MATISGKAAVWGIGITGATASAAILSSTLGFPTDAAFDRTADIEYLRDQNGNTVGVCYYAHGRQFTITAVPADRSSAFTESDAQANADSLLPDPGTVIYIADADSAVTDAKYTGTGGGGLTGAKYICTGSRIRKSNTTAAVIEMDLRQQDNYDMSTTIS